MSPPTSSKYSGKDHSLYRSACSSYLLLETVSQNHDQIVLIVSLNVAEAKIGVFWDVKECPIPTGLDPSSVYQNIKSALAKKGYHGEVTITPYCDRNQFPDGPDDFESAGMKLVPAG